MHLDLEREFSLPFTTFLKLLLLRTCFIVGLLQERLIVELLTNGWAYRWTRRTLRIIFGRMDWIVGWYIFNRAVYNFIRFSYQTSPELGSHTGLILKSLALNRVSLSRLQISTQDLVGYNFLIDPLETQTRLNRGHIPFIGGY